MIFSHAEIVITAVLLLIGFSGFVVSYFQPKPERFPPPPGSGWTQYLSKCPAQMVPEIVEPLSAVTSSSRTVSVARAWKKELPGGVVDYFLYTELTMWKSVDFTNHAIFIRVGRNGDTCSTRVSNTPASRSVRSLAYVRVEPQPPALRLHHMVAMTSTGEQTDRLRQVEPYADRLAEFCLVEWMPGAFVAVGPHGWTGDSSAKMIRILAGR